MYRFFNKIKDYKTFKLHILIMEISIINSDLKSVILFLLKKKSIFIRDSRSFKMA